ncbi:replication initiation protein RepC [Paenochrobactrum gallinarii]|uniref:Replication initiation protein RepC n=1 Tax=Paenochrobactrum gallinarii TaxID=643673 RepID=A0A841LTN3_9HYPH|nr:plasmid replication protein RepC [Paenochrobactrum gallinarii]MBB6261473.1 replication initiation protein RepC [Paenochrobactrum gallinarii]
MDSNIVSTPFGARPMSFALFSTQKQAHRITENTSVDKWKLYRWLCEGKSLFKVGDRTLAVLNALLSFYPSNMLSTDNSLIVFPSNRQLSLRAHGMADATLRRHLACLLEAGLIIRKDSPNGKRYAHKDKQGVIANAYGFSLAPLLARAAEIEEGAQYVRAQQSANRLMRERLTLHRRDIAKLIEMATETGITAQWEAINNKFRDIIATIPRRADTSALELIVNQMQDLRHEIDNALNSLEKIQILSTNEAQTERQHNSSDSESIIKFETTEQSATNKTISELKAQTYPLELVLRACPDLQAYSSEKIKLWKDFIAVTAQIRSYLGISPSAYQQAVTIFGQQNAAIIIACMLQRLDQIQSAGGYLRNLTNKATHQAFSVGPMLMSLLRSESHKSHMN